MNNILSRLIVVSISTMLVIPANASAQAKYPKLKKIPESQIEKTYTRVKDKNNLWGFKNSQEKMVIPFVFKFVEKYNEACTAIVQANTGYGLIDNKGNYVIAPNYKSICSSAEKLPHYHICMIDDSSCDVIDNSGNILGSYNITKQEKVTDNIFKMYGQDNSTFIISPNGQKTSDCYFILKEIWSADGSCIYIVSKNDESLSLYPVVFDDGTAKFYNTKVEALPEEGDRCYAEPIFIALNENWEPILDPNMYRIVKYYNDRLIVRNIKSLKCGVCDLKGNWIIQRLYDKIRFYKNPEAKDFYAAYTFSKWKAEFGEGGDELGGEVDVCKILDLEGHPIAGPFDDVDIFGKFIYAANGDEISVYDRSFKKVANGLPVCNEPDRSKFHKLDGRFYSYVDHNYYYENYRRYVDEDKGSYLTIGTRMDTNASLYSELLQRVQKSTRLFMKNFIYTDRNAPTDKYEDSFIKTMGIEDLSEQHSITELTDESGSRSYYVPYSIHDSSANWFHRMHDGDYYKCALIGETGELHAFIDGYDGVKYLGISTGKEGEYSATTPLHEISTAVLKAYALDPEASDSIDRMPIVGSVRDCTGDFLVRVEVGQVVRTETFVYDSPKYVNIAGVPVMVNSGRSSRDIYSYKNVVIRLDGTTLEVKNAFLLPDNYSITVSPDGWYASHLCWSDNEILKFNNNDELILKVKPQDHISCFYEDSRHGILYLGGYTTRMGYISEENQYIETYSLKDGSFIESILPKAQLGKVEGFSVSKDGQLKYKLYGSSTLHDIINVGAQKSGGKYIGAIAQKYAEPWGNTTMNMFMVIVPEYKICFGLFPGMKARAYGFDYKNIDGELKVVNYDNGESFTLSMEDPAGTYRINVQ